MTPGVNDRPRNTGTLPKSNRRNERNREVISTNGQSMRSVHLGRPQHPNNLLDWQPVSDREPVRSSKNSNARTTSSAPPVPYQDFSDIAHSGTRQHNYSGDDYIQWQEMAQPVDSRAQSPPHIQGSKPKNVDRMPDRRQVESRLNQIRDYIRVTSTMMESLSQSSDPRAHTQHEKLSKMVEDLSDSETKLAKLLENYRGPILESDNHPSQPSNQMKRFAELLDILNSQENSLPVCNRRNGEDADGEDSVESQLRRKMEASQRKLAELQDHQANLVGMQIRVRERLQEARQAQQALSLHENQVSNASQSPGWDNENRPQQQLANNSEVLESETAALKGKLAALQNRKKQMDTLVAELQAIEMSDRASCSSDNSRYAERDKVVELETLTQQLAHLKGLMEEATRVRDNCNPTAEHLESESNANATGYESTEVFEDEGGATATGNSFDRNSEAEEVYAKFNHPSERLTVDQIQAVTRELKEQQAFLQSARAELQRLKNPSAQSTLPSAPALSVQNSAPPSSSMSNSASDRKPSNNVSTNGDIANGKKRQLEELVRKDPTQSSNVNRDAGGDDWSCRRGSNTQLSHSSTPANMWPVPNVIAGGSNEQSVDGISTAENLLDIGPQINTIENGFTNNWWNVPAIPPMAHPTNVGHGGSVEYYRQLLMGSQAQQLQMMSTTMQQCCQLLWSQQRELQSMRVAITQLQQQFRQTLNQPRITNNENHEDYSNLSRSTHHLGNTLDASLPPSSSLPNLVSLPTASSASSNPAAATSTNLQQHHHNNQQLNNQVPPGNRANNYWDNFRSYSRQNLLSGNSKTVTDSQPGPSGNSSISTNTAATSVHTSLVRDKRNREHGTTDNISLPSVSSSDAQYSLNLQLPTSNLQLQEREIQPPPRNNILTNEATQSQQVENFWEEAHSSFRLVPESNDDIYSLRHLSGEMRDILLSLVAANRRQPDYLVIILREIKAISEDQRLRPRLLRSLRALHDTQSPNNPLNETTYQTASESCQSSDDDSDIGAQASPLLNTNSEHQSLITEFSMPLHSTLQGPQSMPALLVDHFEFEGAAQLERPTLTAGSSVTPGYNEDLAEADQSRPEASSNQQNSLDDGNDAVGEDSEMYPFAGHNAALLEADREISNSEMGNDDSIVMDNSILDRIPTRLLHH